MFELAAAVNAERERRERIDAQVIAALKLAATTAWTLTLVLFAMGFEEPTADVSINYYAFGCLTCMLAMTTTGMGLIRCEIRRTVIGESRRAQARLAAGLAAALAEELEERGLVCTAEPEYAGDVTPIR